MGFTNTQLCENQIELSNHLNGHVWKNSQNLQTIIMQNYFI